MSSAFNEFADKFDPEELAETFDHNLGSSFLLRWRNKSKYWPMYCDLYPIMTDKGSNRFPQMYAEEFVAAYDRQIAEYKRLGTGGEHLKATVIMNESDLVTDPAITDVAVNDPAATDAAANEEEQDSAIDLNDSAKLVLQELEQLDSSSIEKIDEDDDFKETVAFEGISLDDLPADEPDRAEG